MTFSAGKLSASSRNGGPPPPTRLVSEGGSNTITSEKAIGIRSRRIFIKMRIIDADGHVAEGASLALEAMQRWPDYIAPRADSPGLVIEGRNYPESSGPGAGCPTEHGISAAEGINCRSAEGVLGDADRDQIDTMVLYPSLGLCTPTLEDPKFAAGFARLYNEWIADYCRSSNGRLHGIAVTPIEHGEVAIEIMREAKDLGLVATHIPPALKTRNLDHPDLDPFYAAAVELGMPLGIHGAPGVHLPKIGVDRFTNYIQVHCVSFPFDQMAAMTALVSGGVFDRHPKLRVAFLEAGVGWVPYWMDRFDEKWEKRTAETPRSELLPSEYVKAGRCYFTCEGEESALPLFLERFGNRCVMYASDYPHWDTGWPNTAREILERADLTSDTKERIMSLNAREFYHLP
jgi:uncharacterized protein